MPKCGGKPASVVEKAIAWGSVTTASVSPTSRFLRRAGRTRGSALVMAFIGAGPPGSLESAVVSERLGVPRQGQHDGHHQLLPGGRQRTVLVAGGPRQGAEVERDVTAFLIVEAAFLPRGHVAANEAGHDGIDPLEIHARVGGEGLWAGQGRVEHPPLHYRAQSLGTVTGRASLAVHMCAPHIIVATSERRRGGNFVNALLRVVIADLQIERGSEETAVSGNVADEIVVGIRLEAVG